MANEQTERPMVKWRVTLFYQVSASAIAFPLVASVDVEAPENDLQAAAKAGWMKWAQSGDKPKGSFVMRIDVWRLDDEPTPSSASAQQPGLWDEVAEMEA